MKRPEWEQDLRNRQRNIVFPDTVLNQGTFYRNLLSRNAHLNSIQRIGMVILSLLTLCANILIVASTFGSQDDFSRVPWITRIASLLFAPLGLIIGVRLMKRAFSPRAEVDRPKRRKDYPHPTRF
jgi:hypothetical protein